MRISDWSSDVCSSDLAIAVVMAGGHGQLFVQCFQRAPFGALGPLKSLVPEEAAALCKDIPLALGSGAPALAAAGWAGRTGLSAPRAADVRLLAEAARKTGSASGREKGGKYV